MWDGVCHWWCTSCNWAPPLLGGIHFVYFISQQQGNTMVPPFSVGDPSFQLSTVYCLPPSSHSPFFGFFSLHLGFFVFHHKPPYERGYVCTYLLCVATPMW